MVIEKSAARAPPEIGLSPDGQGTCWRMAVSTGSGSLTVGYARPATPTACGSILSAVTDPAPSFSVVTEPVPSLSAVTDPFVSLLDVKAPSFSLAAVTAPFLSFGVVTALFLSCGVPTDLAGSLAAA